MQLVLLILKQMCILQIIILFDKIEKTSVVKKTLSKNSLTFCICMHVFRQSFPHYVCTINAFSLAQTLRDKEDHELS